MDSEKFDLLSERIEYNQNIFKNKIVKNYLFLYNKF